MARAKDDRGRVHDRWAHFRFQVVGRLLASPPEAGGLARALGELAGREWIHPVSFQPVRFGFSTVERWYYEARRAPVDPVANLRRRQRKDLGRRWAISAALGQALAAQHQEHGRWSYQLHRDNLVARAKADPSLGQVPSYASVVRWMKARALVPSRRPRGDPGLPGVARALERLSARETRSYEATHVNGLWHLDFHHGSLKVVLASGERVTPIALGLLDDRSRKGCHLQWYLAETAENLVHGSCQAFAKCGLPRAQMSDNGAAMLAGEYREGLARLGIVHELTLPYSPQQNGKQESFWGQVEGRLCAMLENVPDLTLAALNEASCAWLELEYNRKVHGETGETPLARWLAGPDVGRPCPSAEALREAFTVQARRSQRRSDGTFSLAGVRFEVPGRYRHFESVHVRYAAWDLSRVTLVDGRTGEQLGRVFPVDKAKNADGERRALAPLAPQPPPAPAPQVAPLLERLLAEYRASGLPAAYLPKDDSTSPKGTP